MDPILGQIILWSGNFVPVGWLACEGQLLSVQQNMALFSILGTTYGGNGTTTFGLPDLRGRVPIGKGEAPGIGTFIIGHMDGSPNHTLTTNELSNHTHGVTVNQGTVTTAGIPYNGAAATTNTPNSNASLGVADTVGGDIPNIYNNAQGTGNIGSTTAQVQGMTVEIGATGGNQPFSIMQPYTTLTYIIATEGIYPQRP